MKVRLCTHSNPIPTAIPSLLSNW